MWEKIRQECAHAFAVTPPASGFPSEDMALMDKIARLIVNRGMAVPALLFLESLGPLGFLGGQVIHGLKPFLDVITNPAEVERFALLLERRDSVERLSTLLQEQSNIPL